MRTSNPRWSILIATVGRREDRFTRLLELLLPQATDDVEIIAYWNNFEKPLGEIRQSLVEEATGDYINFIDDDDKIPSYYCAEVLDALSYNPDYVGWQQQLYQEGMPQKPTFHSLEHSYWHEDEDGWYRNISHLNPIKRDIAKKVTFLVQDGVPEDYDWAQRVAPLVKSEKYIDKIMYEYYPSAEDSIWRGINENGSYRRPTVEDKHFKWHTESKVYYGDS